MKRTKYLLALGALGIWTLALGQDQAGFTGADAVRAMDEASMPLVPDGKAVGRFSLVPAVYDGLSGRQNALFRIDTMTGQVWQLGGAKFKTGDPQGFSVQAWNVVSEAGAMKMGFYLQQEADKASRAKEKR